MQLSKNFTLQEFTKSQTAQRLGIDNTPSAAEVERLKLLAQNVLQPVRNHFGPVIITSGYRCFKLNRAIGSKESSDHVKGFAADFEVIGASNLEVAKWIEKNLQFKQLILEFFDHNDPHSGWVHCSFDERQLINTVLTASKKWGDVVYLNGLPD